MWNDNFLFCCVISAASSFPIKGRRLHNVKQDFTVNFKINNIWNHLTFTCHVMFTLFAMATKAFSPTCYNWQYNYKKHQNRNLIMESNYLISAL